MVEWIWNETVVIKKSKWLKMKVFLCTHSHLKFNMKFKFVQSNIKLYKISSIRPSEWWPSQCWTEAFSEIDHSLASSCSPPSCWMTAAGAPPATTTVGAYGFSSHGQQQTHQKPRRQRRHEIGPQYFSPPPP